MTDLALVMDPATGSFDLALDGADLLLDDGLETAAIISFFTDRRAHPDDVIPDGSTNQRGWWGDLVEPRMRPTAAQGASDPDRIGSRFWLLKREKQTQDVLVRAKQYGDEAFEWMVEDGIASSVTTTAIVAAPSVLGVTIAIQKPDGSPPSTFRYELAWSAQFEKGF